MTYYQVKPEYDGFPAFRPLIGGELFTMKDLEYRNLQNKRLLFIEVEAPKFQFQIINNIRTWKTTD